LEILFRIEKTLNALAVLEKIGSVEAELKGALVSQYLMQSDRSTGEQPRICESDSVAMW